MSTNNTCANCGMGEEYSDGLKNCNGCHMVKYCSRDCQVAHRPQHKKACKKRAAELYDEALFKKIHRKECPICMLTQPLYSDHLGMSFYSCCGKLICDGCSYAMMMRGEKDICPFCRTPGPTSVEEELERVKKLMEKGNADAHYALGSHYDCGNFGLLQDRAKASELWLKAGELGCAEAYFNLGCLYHYGDGLERDVKKAKYYYELAAMNGHLKARNNLSIIECNAGNHKRAFKHSMVSASAGDKDSLGFVKKGYMRGIVTKDEYDSALREYQKSQDEMKSDARDRALAVHIL